jgi:hypothetical protein
MKKLPERTEAAAVNPDTLLGAADGLGSSAV